MDDFRDLVVGAALIGLTVALPFVGIPVVGFLIYKVHKDTQAETAARAAFEAGRRY